MLYVTFYKLHATCYMLNITGPLICPDNLKPCLNLHYCANWEKIKFENIFIIYKNGAVEKHPEIISSCLVSLENAKKMVTVSMDTRYIGRKRGGMINYNFRDKIFEIRVTP